MIPDFNEHGYLPPGIHPATMEEIEDRLGRETEIRRVQVESLRWLIDIARRVGVARIVIDGSFVTDVPEPNDVDCLLLVTPAYPHGCFDEVDQAERLPFLSVKFVEDEAFNYYAEHYFAADRKMRPKGMLEVTSWS